MIGKTLSHYKILVQLGAGGMGVVYRARDERLERDVALKFLPGDALTDDEARKRFRKEALALSSLNHPNIATVFDFDRQEGVDFLAMEFIAGESLAAKLARGPLAAKDVALLGGQVAAALEEAHEHGVIHRDLKPGNVMVTPKGQAKVLDFGLAKLMRPVDDADATRSIAETKALSGTLPYMAPEQLRNEAADARTDVHALGALLYEMATGKRAFAEERTPQLTDAILHRLPVSARAVSPRISPELDRIILKCLEKDPENRYQSAKEVAVDLRRLASSGSAIVAALPAPTAWSGRRAALAAGIAMVAVIALLLAFNVGGARERIFAGAASGRKIESLAVLPLDNMTGDPAQEYFADGMTEALITELSKISALKVISRTSAMQYKGSKKPMPHVARELGVDALIEGSVLREGDQVRITVQLIHGSSDRHLWAQSFDRELRGILALHSEVARAIANEIKVKLTPQEQTQLASARAVIPKAYELYVLGRHYRTQRTIDHHKQAIECFRKAIELDPGYAPAHAALVEAYVWLGEHGGLPVAEARSLAAAAIRKALEVDKNLAEVYTSLGVWKLYFEWNWAESEQAFKRAIELNPGYAPAHHDYGRSLGIVGRFEEAERELLRAKELDPLSSTINGHIGQIYMFARQYDRAAKHLQQSLELNPNQPSIFLHILGEVYLARGRFAEAITRLQRAVESSGEPSAHFEAMLGCAYARANRRQDALKVLKRLRRRSEQGLVSSFDMASLYAAFGDNEQALAWLERGYEQRDTWLVTLKAWPWFDSLLPDPRFQALLRRINLPQ